MNQKAIMGLFPENKPFGEQIFRFMQLISGVSIVTLDTFLQTGINSSKNSVILVFFFEKSGYFDQRPEKP